MSEHIRKPDRRTQRTRQLLRDALMELIVEKKEYDAVSIQDITDRADVARTTFYLHYKDKDELLLTGMAEMYDELVNNHSEFEAKHQFGTQGADQHLDTSDYDHVAQYAEFYRLMLSNKGSLTFMLGVLRYLETLAKTNIFCHIPMNDQESSMPPGLIATMMAWVQAGAIDWWLREGQDYSAEDMAKMHYQMVMFGLASALRLDVQPPETVP